MKTIDLRSDTVTLPTPEMYRAIQDAPLGDDLLEGDLTTLKLEELAARMLGKEAALLTSSGTQSNLLALLSHCSHGDEVILGDQAHILHYETGGAHAIGGLGLRTVRNDEAGRLDLDELRGAIRESTVLWPGTALICLENTQNICGGTVLTEADIAAVVEIAREHGLPVHVDGARIFNASVALGLPVSRLAAGVDSVAFSLCKGLACPIGSVLVGSAAFIDRARRFRKMLGGAMRQSGIIAAPGILALETMVERLAEDHRNADLLAQGLSQLPGVSLAPWPQTNLVFFRIEGWDRGEFIRRCAEQDLLCLEEGGRVRMVTHYGIEREGIEDGLERISSVLDRTS